MKFILKLLLAPLMLVLWIVEWALICLGIAFLLSPYGLHYLAVKLTARFIGMRMLLKERIYG